MKGLKKISDATQATREKIELYYSFATDTVYSKSGAGRHFVTYLINPNSPQDIQKAVERWKNL